MFKPNGRLDRIRAKYKRQYDKVFKQITECEKGSDEHERLLKQERCLHRRTMALINHTKHKHYFEHRREHFIDMMIDQFGVNHVAKLFMSVWRKSDPGASPISTNQVGATTLR
jgi:hypothetical protein